MSLNFNITDIPEDVKTVVAKEDQPMYGIKVGDRIMNPVTNSLIWSTIGVGIGVINDDTADEFAARLDLWQKVNGPLLQGYDEDTDEFVPVFITRDDVLAHKGLSTNVFPMERRASWLKRVVGQSDVFASVTEPKYKR